MTQTTPVFSEGLDEICQEFLIESYENLDDLDRNLVALEQDPTSRPLLASIFRTIHTIKGTSGFLAFSRLESLTHGASERAQPSRRPWRSSPRPTSTSPTTSRRTCR